MYEWEVKKKIGMAIVYAEKWKLIFGRFCFYEYGHIVKTIEADEVVSIQKTYPTIGEMYIHQAA